jgi:tRNA(Ile)-lysidine synthase
MDLSLLMCLLENRVRNYIQTKGLIEPSERLLLAVSGGADSTALLHITMALRKVGLMGTPLCVHFNHQLRGAWSNGDQRFVEEQARALSIPCISKRLDVHTYASSRRLSIETAARDLRIKALLELAKVHHCHAIATGHHQNDNAETLLFRILRGTGYRGLGGIRPSRMKSDCRFVSPLLCVTRDQIMDYLTAHQIPWREDHTNQDCGIKRNHIRHRLLPLLESQSNRSVLEGLSRLSDAARTLQTYVARHIENTPRVYSLDQDTAHIDSAALLAQPIWIRHECLRQALVALGCREQNLSQWHYDHLLKALETDVRSFSMTLPGRFLVSKQQATLAIRTPQQPPTRVSTEERPFSLKIPGDTLANGIRINTSFTEVHTAHMKCIEDQQDRCVEYLDADTLTSPIHVRLRQPGDRFCPIGKKTAQKLGKFLSKAKADESLRKKVLLVCDQTSILWVWPLRLSQHVCITAATKRIMRIEIRTASGSEDHSQIVGECP